MKKVYCTAGAKNYASWINNSKTVDDPEFADIILFTGGEDVHPSLYGEEMHPRTFSNLNRDLEEKAIFEKMRKNQLALGICRGLI